MRRVSIEQAHNTRKGYAASVRRQSRQRLRCVRPYKRYTEAFRLTRDGAPRSSRPTEGVADHPGAGGQAGEDTGPYRQARRYLRHRVSDLAYKFRGQVVAREAERQRTPTSSLKTGVRSQDTIH